MANLWTKVFNAGKTYAAQHGVTVGSSMPSMMNALSRIHAKTLRSNEQLAGLTQIFNVTDCYFTEHLIENGSELLSPIFYTADENGRWIVSADPSISQVVVDEEEAAHVVTTRYPQFKWTGTDERPEVEELCSNLVGWANDFSEGTVSLTLTGKGLNTTVTYNVVPLVINGQSIIILTYKSGTLGPYSSISVKAFLLEGTVENLTVSTSSKLHPLFPRADVQYVADETVHTFIFYGTSGVWFSTTGLAISVYDGLRGLVENQELNDSVVTAIELLRKPTSEVATCITNAAAFVDSTYTGVKNFWRAFVRGYSQGGIVGAVKFLILYYQGLASLSDDDGKLMFSDNSALRPTSYITGIISAITGVIANIVTSIGIMISGVLGGVLTVLGSLVSAAVKAVQFDITLERCAINDSNLVFLDCTPYGFFKEKAPLTYLTDYLPVVLEGLIVAVPVPGGYLFIGKGSDTEFYSEFHPDIKDRRGLLTGYAQGKCYTGVDMGSDPSATYRNRTMQITYYNTHDPFLSDGWVAAMHAECDNHFFLNANDEKGVSVEDSLTIGQIILANVCTYLLYINRKLNSDGIVLTITEAFTQATAGGFDTVAFTCDQSGYTSDELLVLWALTQAQDSSLYSVGCVDYNGNNFSPWKRPWEVLGILANGYLETPPHSSSRLGMDVTSAADTITHCVYCTDYVTIPSQFEYCVTPPKYTPGSVIQSLILTTLTTIAVAATAVVFVVGAKVAITKKRASLARNAESTWETYKGSGDKKDLQAYKKAVTKNNLFTGIFGGDKFSKTGFWSSSSSSSPSETETVVTSLLSGDAGATGLSSTERSLGVDYGVTDMSELRTLITGQ